MAHPCLSHVIVLENENLEIEFGSKAGQLYIWFFEVQKKQNILFKNATVWTSESEGILENTDVLVTDGKIKSVGKDLNFSDVKIIDATKSLYRYMDEFCTEEGLAASIAKDINNSIIAIYGVENSTDYIASRFRAQIAENSKMFTSLNVVPEMNHNEIEGWNSFQFKNLNKVAIWIYDEDDNPRILDRIKITTNLLEKIGVNNFLIKTTGKNYEERCLKLIYLNDWISYYLALENNIDPIPVNRIMELKSKLT